jgi:hypothetical protein
MENIIESLVGETEALVQGAPGSLLPGLDS